MRLWNGSDLGGWLRNLWENFERETRPRSPEDVAAAVNDGQTPGVPEDDAVDEGNR